jgi:hypothetical protein
MSHLLPHEALERYKDGQLTWAEVLSLYPYLIPTILELCGSSTGQVSRNTRGQVRNALQER